jgi:hypothetical protein
VLRTESRVTLIKEGEVYLPLHEKRCTRSSSTNHGTHNEFQRQEVAQLVTGISTSGSPRHLGSCIYSYDKRPSNRQEIYLRNCQRTGSGKSGARPGFEYYLTVRKVKI